MDPIADCIRERVFDTEFLEKVVGSLDDNLRSFRFAENTRLDDLFYSSSQGGAWIHSHSCPLSFRVRRPSITAASRSAWAFLSESSFLPVWVLVAGAVVAVVPVVPMEALSARFAIARLAASPAVERVHGWARADCSAGLLACDSFPVVVPAG